MDVRVQTMEIDSQPTPRPVAVAAVAGGPEVVDLEEKRRQECLADMERIEREFQDVKEKFYREKVEHIRKEIELISAGTHEKLLQKLKECDQKREEKLWAAEQWRQYQLMSIEHTCSADKKQAEEEYEADKVLVKEKMIQALQDRQKKLEDEKNTMSLTDGSNAADNRVQLQPPRNLRSTKKGKENVTVLNHRAKKLNPSHINYMLKESEISEDIAVIQKALAARGGPMKTNDIIKGAKNK